MEQFVIETRYETWSSNGKTWSNWYVYKRNPMTEKEAKEVMKQCKANCADIDKRTKLKHEFALKPYEEYVAEMNQLKNDLKKKAKQQEEYFKSDAYKELQKKKRQASKELKERQRIYQETHKKEEADL